MTNSEPEDSLVLELPVLVKKGGEKEERKRGPRSMRAHFVSRSDFD